MTSQSDAERFEELYRATRKDVLAYLVRRSHDPDHAADLLSELPGPWPAMRAL